MASREADNLAGNGEQTGFATGATRSTSEGKIDFEGHINPEVLQVFGEYMHRHRVQRDGKIRASDNWQRGIPIYRYVKSLIRHTFEFWRMWRGTPVTNIDSGKYFTFDDVLCAILFNTMGLLLEMKRARVLDYTLMPEYLRESLEKIDQPKPEPVDPWDTCKEGDKEPSPIYWKCCSCFGPRGYICTRKISHTGQHVATDGQKVCDVWPQTDTDCQREQCCGQTDCTYGGIR